MEQTTGTSYSPHIRYKLLDGFAAAPSHDGEFLLSQTVPEGGSPVLIMTPYHQLSRIVTELNMAAALMARRSGRTLDSDIFNHIVLEPNIKDSLFRFDHHTGRLRMLFSFDRDLPLPMAVSLTDWHLMRERCEAARTAGML